MSDRSRVATPTIFSPKIAKIAIFGVKNPRPLQKIAIFEKSQFSKIQKIAKIVKFWRFLKIIPAPSNASETSAS